MKRFFSIFCCFMIILSFSSALTTTAASDTKLVAITFDDGPSKYTGKLLDGLKETGAKATFFMVGSNVNVYPDIIKRMKAEGHQLATHTMNHANLAKLSASGIQQEVCGVDERISGIVGEGVYYLRPPYGSFNATVKSTVKTPLIYWSLDTEDWRSRNTDSVYRTIVNQVKDGDIILLHDLYETSVDGALKAIKELQAEGYVFVTVEQLLRRRGITPEAGVVYYDAPNEGINLPAVISPVIATKTTALGTKVYIGRCSAEDTVYFTKNGDTPGKDGEKYVKPYYVKDAESIKAVSFSQNELSDITEQKVSADAKMRKEDLDKAYYRYRVDFLQLDTRFKPGMKI